MKRVLLLLLTAAVLLSALACWLGIGPYVSGSAVQDLKEALKTLHGEPYAGKTVENGTEDMEFSVTPETFFATNYNLRNMLGWDYRYRCEVIYTVRQGEEIVSVRKVTYGGIDPVGPGEEYRRAYLIQE